MWICVLYRSVISYKTDEKPLYSAETVANSGIVSLLKLSKTICKAAYFPDFNSFTLLSHHYQL